MKLNWKGSKKLLNGYCHTYTASVDDIRLTVTHHVHGKSGVYYGMVRSALMNVTDMSHELGTDPEAAKEKWPHQVVAMLANEEHKLLRVIDVEEELT